MQTEDKAKENEEKRKAEEQDWKVRFNDLVQSCQNELKRTTQIGMKMLSASQSNAQLHENYEELGRMAMKAMKDGSLKWESLEARETITKIEALLKTLENLEEDVNNIKKS